MSRMFNLGALATNVLNSIDNVAKETLEEPKISATALRSRRKAEAQDKGSDEDDEPEEERGESFINNTFTGRDDSADPTGHGAAHMSMSSPHQGTNGSLSSKSSYANVAAADIDPNNPDPFIMVPSNNNSSNSNINSANNTMYSSTPNSSSASFVNMGVVPPSSSGGGSSNSGATDSETALKRQLKKKNQEIERLNTECLELEETTSSLKKEVQEAWDNYKQAQERNAARESELLDEIREIQKSKATDKKQAVESMNSASVEVNAVREELKEAQEEIAAMEASVLEAQAAEKRWAEEKAYYQDELEKAKSSTVQGVQNLVEELRAAHKATEQLQSEHAVLRRQSEHRQQELEKETSDLTDSLTVAQKEIQRLTFMVEQLQSNRSDISASSVGSDGVVTVTTTMSSNHTSNINNMCMNRACVALQQENLKMAMSIERNAELLADGARVQKQYQAEARAAQLVVQNEKERSARAQSELVSQYTKQIGELEKQLNQYQNSRALSSRGADSSSSSSNNNMPPAHWSSNMQNAVASMDDGDGTVTSSTQGLNLGDGLSIVDFQRMEQEMLEVRSQAMNFSRLLMKKQSELEDLQSERSTLKSKLLTAEGRYTNAERQLSRLQDLEEGCDLADEEDLSPRTISNSSSSSSSSSSSGAVAGLKRRGGNNTPGGSSSGAYGDEEYDGGMVRRTKVISDLEKIGVKPGVQVARAVNFVDTWAILLNRTLRQYPLARLAFIIYLLGLHVWVMLVLVIHIHAVELDTVSDLTNNKLHPHLSSA